MPRGMLLSGAPGTGKTFLAAVIAAEAQLPFIYIDASSIRGMFWGMTEMMIMKLFRDARGLGRKYAPDGQRGACIVFMDEIDSIGMNRGGQSSGGMMMGGMMMGGGQGLNTLLNQMDSLANLVEDRWRYKLLRWFGLVRGPVADKPLVFIIGATNRPEVLDPALIRPGRLDRMIVVHEPDAEGRRDIIDALPVEEAARPRYADGAAAHRLDGLDPDHDQDDHQRGPHQGPRGWSRLPDVQGLARCRRRADDGAQAADPLLEPDRPTRDRLPRGRPRGGRSLPAAVVPDLRRPRSSVAAMRSATCNRSRSKSGRRCTRAGSRRRSWSRWRATWSRIGSSIRCRPGRRATSRRATNAAVRYVSQFGMGPDEADRAAAARAVPACSVRGRRARDARRAVRRDRAAPARKGAGHPPPGATR